MMTDQRPPLVNLAIGVTSALAAITLVWAGLRVGVGMLIFGLTMLEPDSPSLLPSASGIVAAVLGVALIPAAVWIARGRATGKRLAIVAAAMLFLVAAVGFFIVTDEVDGFCRAVISVLSLVLIGLLVATPRPYFLKSR